MRTHWCLKLLDTISYCCLKGERPTIGSTMLQACQHNTVHSQATLPNYILGNYCFVVGPKGKRYV